MSKSTFEGGREKLLRKAAIYWKAYYISARIGCFEWPQTIVQLPQLIIAPRKRLTVYADDLQDYFEQVIHQIAAVSGRERVWSTAIWLAEKYDQWQSNEFGVMTLSTVWEFEEKIGVLTAREVMDLPPYAEILLQGASDAAYRHPEYMIARDLGFLYRLYLDADRVLIRVNWKAPPEWAKFANVHVIALGRAVIPELCTRRPRLAVDLTIPPYQSSRSVV